ncbi:hypothetical protein QR680_014316 [Steinernema hermaphroditum]|uniref:Uncharacterized protein n=1 Tax=Steinernema hermaphroditum TaxID=289476 RepID=A0AA39M300_9BILA|nr:hypothetical protein QR680_014316 [Steinernema hermaphroditum]
MDAPSLSDLATNDHLVYDHEDFLDLNNNEGAMETNNTVDFQDFNNNVEVLNLNNKVATAIVAGVTIAICLVFYFLELVFDNLELAAEIKTPEVRNPGYSMFLKAVLWKKMNYGALVVFSMSLLIAIFMEIPYFAAPYLFAVIARIIYTLSNTMYIIGELATMKSVQVTANLPSDDRLLADHLYADHPRGTRETYIGGSIGIAVNALLLVVWAGFTLWTVLIFEVLLSDNGNKGEIGQISANNPSQVTEEGAMPHMTESLCLGESASKTKGVIGKDHSTH